MLINKAGVRSQLLPPSAPKQTVGNSSFVALLSHGLEKVHSLQTEADASVLRLAAGDGDDLHEVMAALERASLALELTVAIRNKLVESYQEIMRMQV